MNLKQSDEILAEFDDVMFQDFGTHGVTNKLTFQVKRDLIKFL